jgi:hypothetical protein
VESKVAMDRVMEPATAVRALKMVLETVREPVTVSTHR